MKKLLVIVCSISVIWCLMIVPVSAASTVFVDKADAAFTNVTTKVGAWQFENNVDVVKTLYSKGLGAKDLEISLVYKMNGNITAFKIDTLNCNGLGDSTLDVAAYVSSNGTSWTKVETKVTEPVMDPVYITLELAYWLNSTVSNKNPIPANITYLKISLLPFTREKMVSWSTTLDDIFITYDAKAVPTATKPASSAVASSPASSTVSAVISTANSIAENSLASGTSEVTSIDSTDTSSDTGSALDSLINSSQAASSSASAGDNGGTNMPVLFGAIALGALAVGAVLFFVLKKKK